MFKITKKIIDWNGKALELETGKIARQATGAVTVRMGETIVLCTVVGNKTAKEDIDFFPLTVNYLERFYAAGKIPGGFNKRESKPSEHETLVSRLIDRPIRPLFPEGFFNEVQVVCTVLSYDHENEADILALIGASAALTLSGIPFLEPIAAARVGYRDGEFILNPSHAESANLQLDLVVSGTESSVLMVESEAKELPENIMLDAVMFGHNSFQPIIQAIKDFADEAGKPKWALNLPDNSELKAKVTDLAKKDLISAYSELQKQVRKEKIDLAKNKVIEELVTKQQLNELAVSSIFKNLEKELVRNKILDKKHRIDARSPTDVRAIECEIDLLPKAHGSALFTRGETQSICIITLGTESDEQMVDNLHGLGSDRFMLHYNFPPFSVGEVGAMRAPGRREIGHGKLALRAVNAAIPSKESFPYTIRVVSEITESNGSSSMATVCGTSLALMATGVPMNSPVAGIAMGLIKEGDRFVVLSDIMGDEDHLGDMDFKVAGTANGITALQMDIKINGINKEIMQIALTQAKEGREHILSRMNDTISESRTEISRNAPRITTIKIEKDKIREVIGSGGKVIRDICEKSGAKIDIADDGTINVASVSEEGSRIALSMIQGITTDPKIGDVFDGKVSKIMDFGAIISFLGTREGLLHISELTPNRGSNASDFLSVGQEVAVRVIFVDSRSGKVKLGLKDKPFDSDEARERDPNEPTSSSQEHHDSKEPREYKSHRRGPRDAGDRPRRDGGGDRPRRDRGDRSERGDNRDRGDRRDRSDSRDRDNRDRGDRNRGDNRDRSDRGDRSDRSRGDNRDRRGGDLYSKRRNDYKQDHDSGDSSDSSRKKRRFF